MGRRAPNESIHMKIHVLLAKKHIFKFVNTKLGANAKRLSIPIDVDVWREQGHKYW